MVLLDSAATSDKKLTQIVDAALALAASKSGPWLACRPGCWQCCVGVFAINQADAARLRAGLAELSAREPDRASRVRQRVAESAARLREGFPGDPATGLLAEGMEDRGEFDAFANDEPCPALDPNSGTCDLYSARPITCRVFGPPVRSGDGLGVCELCYRDATEEQIAGCEMVPDPEDMESMLLDDLERRTGRRGKTLVAFALRSDP